MFLSTACLRLMLSVMLSSCFMLFANAQQQRISFDHIGAVEGLSQSNIYTIVQDSRGFMWFGSWDGLNRYDGYRFTVFKNKPADSTSISNNYIYQIIERKSGGMWIATNEGLNYFDRDTERFRRFIHLPGNDASIASNIVFGMAEDRAGMLWVATAEGLDRYNPATNKFVHFSKQAADGYHLRQQSIKTVFIDSHQQIWISVIGEGISRYDPDHDIMVHYAHSAADPSSLNNNSVNVFFEDSGQQMWMGTNGAGLDRFVNGHFIHMVHKEDDAGTINTNVVLALNEDKRHNLWISNENGGIALCDRNYRIIAHYLHDEIDQSSISNNSIYCIYRDGKNNMWLGNFAGWVDVAMSDRLLFAHYRRSMNANSLSSNQVLSIMEDRAHQLWIGTDGGGLNVFDPATGNFERYLHQKGDAQSISGNFVLNTMQDSKGNMWIGAWTDGLMMMNAERKVVKHFRHDNADPTGLSSNNPWKIFEDKLHRIWIGTYDGGLERLNPDGKTFTHFRYDPNNAASISGNNVINIMQDSEGDLWFCTESRGLNLYDESTGKFTRFLHEQNRNSISNNTVNAIVETSDKKLWVATMNGLNLLDKATRRFTRYSTADGLAGDYIFGVLEDAHGRLWISTNRGISCFNPATHSFKNYDMSDGVQSNEFKQLAYCKAASGQMFFGGINGFNSFHPDSIQKISFDPPLVFTGFYIFNKLVGIQQQHLPSPLTKSIIETKSITLPASSYVFSIEFASLNYTDATKKRYAYMLEGFDSSWTDEGTARTVTYTHLDPGSYVFKVRGLNNEGSPSAQVSSIEIVILPPFWLTWWFKILALCVILGLVLLIYWLRIRAIHQQKELLHRQVQLQTRQLLELAEQETNARKEAQRAHEKARLANRELEASERRYSKLFHESPQPMWVFDLETIQFVQVNNAAMKKYGYTEQEFLGMSILQLRPEEEWGRVLQSIYSARSKEAQMVVSGHFRHITKSKELIEVEVHSSPIIFNNRNCRLIIAIDVTGKLLMENKLTKAIIKTQEDERYQIGGELHDNVCQILVSSKMSFAKIKDDIPLHSLPFYIQTRNYINLALEEIRNLSHRLAPVFFDGRPLIDTFKQLADGLNTHDEFKICFYFYPSLKEERISRDIQLNLYRILQEQLTNMAKYSKATYVSVDLMITDANELVMMTADDGIGFELQEVKKGIGLGNMRRRVELFGGSLQIDASPGNGCSITATIPLAEVTV